MGANACTVLQVDSAEAKGQIEVGVEDIAGIGPGPAGHLDDGVGGHDPKVGPRYAQGTVLAGVQLGEGTKAGVLPGVDRFVGDGVGIVRRAPYLLQAGVVGAGGTDVPVDAPVGSLGAAGWVASQVGGRILVEVHKIVRGQADDAPQPMSLRAITRISAKSGVAETTELVGDEAKVGHEVGVGRLRDALLQFALVEVGAMDALLEKGRHAIAGLGIAAEARQAFPQTTMIDRHCRMTLGHVGHILRRRSASLVCESAASRHHGEAGGSGCDREGGDGQLHDAMQLPTLNNDDCK